MQFLSKMLNIPKYLQIRVQWKTMNNEQYSSKKNNKIKITWSYTAEILDKNCWLTQSDSVDVGTLFQQEL